MSSLNLFVCVNCVLSALCIIDYAPQDYEWPGSWHADCNGITEKCVPSWNATTQRVKKTIAASTKTNMDSTETK